MVKRRQKTIQVYKVVRFSLLSAVAGNKSWMVRSNLRVLKPVKYKIGRTVKPAADCGPLCAFDYEWQARYFARKLFGDYGWRVYRCEAVLSRSKHAWQRIEGGFQRTKMDSLPDGTILCRSIKLLKLCIDLNWV